MTSPFTVGAEVYVVSDHATTRHKIAKVRKDGKFLLEGSETQYRPYEYYGMGNAKSWHASPAGKDPYPRTSIEPVNEETTKRFTERVAAKKREHRAYELKRRIHGMSSSHFTDAQLDAIEKALGDAGK